MELGYVMTILCNRHPHSLQDIPAVDLISIFVNWVYIYSYVCNKSDTIHTPTLWLGIPASPWAECWSHLNIGVVLTSNVLSTVALCVQSTLCYIFTGQTQIETYPKSRRHDLHGYSGDPTRPPAENVPLLSERKGNRWEGGPISKECVAVLTICY